MPSPQEMSGKSLSPHHNEIKQERHLRILHDLNTALLQSNHLEAVFEAALDAVSAALGTDRASILLFDGDGILRFKAWRNLSAAYRQAVEGHTPWSQTTPNPPPICVPDVLKEETLAPYHASFHSEGVRALGFFPLVFPGGLLGKFMAYFPEVHPFGDDELLLGQLIANHVGLAVARARDEAELRASESRYRFATEGAGIGTWEWDVISNINRWSDSMGPLHGLPRGTQPTSFEFFMNLIHPEDRDRVQGAITHSLATLEDYYVEFRVVWPDGTIRWKIGKGKVFTDGAGKPVRMSGIGMDITEKKEMEMQLREREAHYHFSLLSTNTCTWERRFTTGEILWSEETYQLFGFDPTTPPSHEVWEARLHPEDVERERALFTSILSEHQETFDDEFRILHPERGVRWLLSRGRVIYSEDGTPLRMVGVNSDITARKQLEAERERLLTTERQARQDLEKASAGLKLLADASLLLGASLDYNDTLERLAALCVPAIADWCAIDITNQEDRLERVTVMHSDPDKVAWAQELQRRYPPRAESPSGIYQVLKSARPEYYPDIPEETLIAAAQDEEHLRIIREVGFSSAIIVPLTARERVIGTLSLVHAESGRRYTREDLLLAEELGRRAAVAVENARLFSYAQQLNEELELRVHERTRRLEQLNHELEAFSYSVSHDLRAPLRSMAGFSQILQEEYRDRLDAQGMHYLQRIAASGERMGELIDALLNLSRLSRNELNITTINLSEMATEILDELRREEPQRQVSIRVAETLKVKGDEKLLYQVMCNLLENAWKFTRDRSDGCIEVGKQDSAIFVRDNGAGFDMAYAGRLFAPFQRLHAAEDFEGTGIGLATVQRIILRHGGRIWSDAKPDKGATFYFTLGVGRKPTP